MTDLSVVVSPAYKKKCFNLAKMVDKTADLSHELAIEALEQGNQHGNINYAVYLVATLGRKHRAESLKTWLVTFGNFAIKDGAVVYKNRKNVDIATLTEKGKTIPYWEYAKEQVTPNTEYNVLEAVQHVLKMVESINMGKNKSKKTVTHVELIERLKGLVAA